MFFLAVFAPPSSAAGVINLVVGSDTAIWNAGTTVDVYSRHPHYPQDFFTDPSSPAYQVMDAAWRSSFKDSFGQPIKFTWWVMGGNIFRDADNLNVPVANTMVLHLMKAYQGKAIRQFGDELSLHYHTYLWSDYNGDGHYFWNQSKTFDECREDFDYTLAQYLLEEETFPVSFRSGWHYMDNSWQQYLDQLLPFSMHDNWPFYIPWYTNEPIGNVQDWSRAPATFVPFHPATNDYQVPGDCKGWNLHSIKMQYITQAVMDSIFASSATGGDQVVCIWNHLPEAFVPNFIRIESFIQSSASNYPSVHFRYCTAVEGMQRWLGTSDQTPPTIEVTESVQDDTLTLTMHTSEDIFQPRPFVALRDTLARCTNLSALCLPIGTNSWTLTIPVSRRNISRIGIAATDQVGNLATRILRYAPDDLYLDNLAPQYTEEIGDWISTTNCAWGTNARITLLTSNTTAKVKWDLPITQPGAYRLSIQVPMITNAAGQVLFEILSNGTHIASRLLPQLPPQQWIYLATPFLDPGQSNVVEMTVSGTNQPGTWAIADVLSVIAFIGATNPAPVAVQLTITRTPKGVLLRFPGEPAGVYEIQRSVRLGSTWDTIETISVPPYGIVEYEDTRPLPGEAFYRIRSH